MSYIMEYSKTLIEFLRIWIMCAGYTLSDIKVKYSQ